ncbi:MAG: ASPIC/UnbV domain-containing protein, partial [Acidobacteriota bacterium]
GDVDLLVMNNQQQLRLWRNEGAQGDFLHLRLRGMRSGDGGTGANTHNLGARVEIEAVKNGVVRRRDVQTATYAGSQPAAIHVGLGDEVVDGTIHEVRVRWADGGTATFFDVPVNQHRERGGHCRALPSRRGVADAAQGATVAVQVTRNGVPAAAGVMVEAEVMRGPNRDLLLQATTDAAGVATFIYGAGGAGAIEGGVDRLRFVGFAGFGNTRPFRCGALRDWGPALPVFLNGFESGDLAGWGP